MKIKFNIALLFTILLIAISVNGQSGNTNNLKIKSFLDNLTSDEFSGTVLVAQNDKIIEKRAYGFASVEYKSKNKFDTKFNIASITKMITAVATLQLYEDGKVKLDEPIGTYLPDYPNKVVRDSVTIHQLLTHTSGLNNFYVTNFDKTDKLKYQKISDFVPLFANEKLLSKPGTKYNYSASGFVVLGLIIEKVSGKSYYKYVKENIFKPAKMLETSELQIDSLVTNKASGYTTNFGESKVLKRNDYYLAKASPAGFHYSTAEDLFNFSKALRNHKILKKETVELMFKPKVKGYNTHIGYGVDVDQRYNQIILGHSGGWNGIHTELMDFTKDKYTVVILSNIDDGGKTGASKVADFFKELIADKESKLKTTTSNYFDVVRKDFTGDTAYETMAFVEKYWRVVGNTGFNKTVYRIATNLEKAGFVLQDKATSKDRLTYRIEKRPLKNDTWEPVDASLIIVGEKTPLLRYATNRNMIYLNSFSTPKEGVEGEVVYIKNAADLKDKNINGKIVFTDARIRGMYQNIIKKGGALGMLTYNNPAYLQPEKNITSIQFRSLPFDAKRKPWAMALSYEAKEKLKAKLSKGKVKVKAKVKTKIYPSEELTIIADIRGRELPKESMVFSAHIQEPGANDNASGVGVQLEMAMLAGKLVANKTVEAKRTLTFLWGDEIGSTRNYIKDKNRRIPDINWGISLDMVGQNTAITGGSFLIEKMPDPSAIWTRGNDKHSEWGGRVLKLEEMKPHYLNDFIIKIFKQQGEFANWEVNTNPYEGGSDHIPFLRANIPSLLLWHFTDQFYHTDNDRIDKVSKETLKNVGTGSLVSAFILINSDKDIAIGLIDDTLNAARIRLQTEFDLSKKAIEKGDPKAKEILILKTWNDWYSKSLASINDMVSKKNTLKIEIADAQSQLQKQTDAFIKRLEK